MTSLTSTSPTPSSRPTTILAFWINCGPAGQAGLVMVISIVTLLMVLVLQNTENRHSAALHVKLDEVVRAEPEARDDLRGVESRPEREIRELTRDDEDALFEGAGE